MNIELLSTLSALNTLTSANQSMSSTSTNTGFDLAMKSLLTALSNVSSNSSGEDSNDCDCSSGGQNSSSNNLNGVTINIGRIEIINGTNGSSTLEDIFVNSNTSTSNTYTDTSTNVTEIKLSDKNSTIEIEQAIETSAEKYGVDADLIRAVIKTESNFNPNVTSSSGAKGLMQLMPINYNYYGLSDPFDIVENIDAGTKHLKSYIDKYDGDIEMGLMAYNGGPTRMADRGVTSIDDIYKMPTETQNYVPKVINSYKTFKTELV